MVAVTLAVGPSPASDDGTTAPAPASAEAEASPAVTAGAGFDAAAAIVPPTAQAPDPAPTPAATPSTQAPPQPSPVVPRAGLKPVSTWEAIRHTPRAQAVGVSMAVAATAAMAIYGVMSMVDQRRQVRAARSQQLPKFTPYPR